MTNHVATYPTDDQHERWKADADAREMPISRWVSCMVEAGCKKFEVDVEPDMTNEELREQNADLTRELRASRARVEQLENRLYRGEQAVVADFVQRDGPVTFQAIVNHVIETAPQRLDEIVEAMEGDTLVRDGDRYERVETEAEREI